MILSFDRPGPKVLFLFLVASALGACESTPTPATDTGGRDGGNLVDGGSLGSIVDIAAGNPDFSILVAAATRAELVDTLDAPGAFTVFAPTNAAFEASGITLAMVEAMPVPQLTGILTYHAIPEELVAADLEAGVVGTVSSFSLIVGTTGGVTLNGGNAITGGANVVTADVQADNGVIHVIDRVLLPPTVADLARYAGLTTLAGAVGTAGLADELTGAGPFTVFAPTNEAFAALPAVPTGDALTQVLLGHVVAAAVSSTGIPASASSLATNAYGDSLTLLFSTTSGVVINGGATVVIADVRGTNGIVHVVDEVILPMNVVDAATAAGLTGLLGAVTAAADLPDGTSVAEALAAEAPYTVFAPTNEAFTAISATLATLTPEQVRDVLLLHVLDPGVFPTPVLAADLPAGTTELATLAAGDITLDAAATPPTVEGADIVVTDIVVTNGVVHVISDVMLP